MMDFYFIHKCFHKIKAQSSFPKKLYFLLFIIRSYISFSFPQN